MNYKLNAGFTLLEVLIVSLVGAVAGVLLIQALITNNGVFYQQSARVSEGVSLNDTSAQITQDIKSTVSIAANYPPTPPYQFTTSNKTLILKVPAIDSSKNVIEQVYDYIIISPDLSNPTFLRRQVFATSPSIRGNANKVIINNLSQVSFNYFDNNGNATLPTQAAKVSFIINNLSKIGTKQEISSTSSEVTLRND